MAVLRKKAAIPLEKYRTESMIIYTPRNDSKPKCEFCPKSKFQLYFERFE